MKKRTSLALILFALLIHTAGPASLCAQDGAGSPRAEAEQSIRKVLYEQAMATLTGDTDKAWMFMSQRAVKFYDIVFEAFRENKTFKEQATQNGVNDAKGFFVFSMRAAAKQFESMPREKMEEAAREQAESPIAFVDDKKATVRTKGGVFHAVLENDGWKIDASDSLKKSFLQTPILTRAGREKIEKY